MKSKSRQSKESSQTGKGDRVTQAGPRSVAPAVLEPDLDAPKWYLNRELTWLAFNRRVLAEAADPRNPLLERVKFIAIASSNLDEFFMKRMGGLQLQTAAGVQVRTVDGRTPAQQMAECYDEVHDLEAEKMRIWTALAASLHEHGVAIESYADLSESDREGLRQHYENNIFPLLTPQTLDPAHPFPWISNLSLNLWMSVRYPSDDRTVMARVKVPVGPDVPRFVRIGATHRFVPLEELISNNLDTLFPNADIDACDVFFVTRNANVGHDDEAADDLLALIENEVRERQFTPVVRVIVHADMDATRRGRLVAELELGSDDDDFERSGIMALRHLSEIAQLDIPDLHDPTHRPVDFPPLKAAPNIFHAIRDRGPFLLHHPYYAFSSSVERFLKEASDDPKVRGIKMTLYRTSEDTKVIEYLIDAANNGKQVAVVVELKARFDEAANIRWASRMEEAGIHVTYGVVGLKTHCKVIQVVRRDFDGLRLYTHMGTGNYHAGTARLYTDLGILSCDRSIGRDVIELFNYLTTGYQTDRHFSKLLPAPTVLKGSLIAKIRREVRVHEASGDGHIQFKINALEDADITQELYRASRAGVKVDLIVRDSCRLRPGVPGVSDNIRVISIVGRFLEHSRLYYFRNGGLEEYYIGSADAMTRNLEQRVEVLCPIEAPHLRIELRRMLDLWLGDKRNAWDMDADGKYTHRSPKADGGDEPLGAQALLVRSAQRAFEELERKTRWRTPKYLRKRRS
ncbi:MAG: polyphosphate kinase 1 [Gammaproteobacteria bacterium]|nr:polyphosphate kinase 1 [Gammaproteobacteria bacterium]